MAQPIRPTILKTRGSDATVGAKPTPTQMNRF